MGPFEYIEPQSIEEALSWLSKYGNKAKVLAGGTDLVPCLKEKRMSPQYIISIGRIANLDYIRFDGDKGIRIGALTTIRSIEQSPTLSAKYGLLCQTANQMASMAIRNVATVGGNLCNCSPAADMSTALLAMRAVTKLASPAGERTVPLEQFLVGPGATVLRSDEILTELQIPTPPPYTAGVYIKYSARGGEDLALVGIAALLTLGNGDRACTEVSLALCAVAPTPMRAHAAEAVLKGKKIAQALIEKAAQIASDESSPIDDIRGSAGYRREMIKVFARDAIRQAAEMAESYH